MRGANSIIPREIQRRAGLTILELLVVISIIGLMLALLLPAVQDTREAARRVQCQSNMRQLAVAIDGFHDVHRFYPPGRFGGTYGTGANSPSWSFLARILPFIEEIAIHDRGRIPESTLVGSGIADKRIGLYRCPSDPAYLLDLRTDAGNMTGFAVGLTSYKGVSGSNWGNDQTFGGPFSTPWNHASLEGSFDGLSEGDGILWRVDEAHHLSKAHVQDGLSNTFLIGEDLPLQNIWCSWPYSNNAYGTCAIPPNHRSSLPLNYRETWSFRSAHPGRVHFALADGSVRSIAQSIHLEIYRSLATRAGTEVVSAP